MMIYLIFVAWMTSGWLKLPSECTRTRTTQPPISSLTIVPLFGIVLAHMHLLVICPCALAHFGQLSLSALFALIHSLSVSLSFYSVYKCETIMPRIINHHHETPGANDFQRNCYAARYITIMIY